MGITKRMTTCLRRGLPLLVGFILGAATVRGQGFAPSIVDGASPPTPELATPGEMRVWLLYPLDPAGPPATGLPGVDASYDPATVFAGASSPLDSLHMSPLERVFWSRHGLFRAVGLFPLHPENPTDDLRQIARVRRRMLGLHQALGLATMASMAVTVVGGQRAIDGRSAGLHKTSLPVTIGLYTTTATLALTAPPKLVPSRGGIDTITFHKAFAILHLAGMIVSPMLAPEADEGTWSRRHVHQAFGYATFAAFSAGMITVTFFR